tara:strand:+ start:1288 stop:2847 length:1560 start_codon:yes stop_codon:yes gene_type:complete
MEQLKMQKKLKIGHLKSLKEEKYALISVFDKQKLNILCAGLKKFNIKFISTGSTAKHIKSLGFKCNEISKLTKFPEILDGRVKTLHPKIHASLLFNRKKESHKKKFNKLQFPKIDFVIVNLYPFKKFIKKNSNEEECLEMIDIGGPTMLRSSAKNFISVTTISQTSDYDRLIENLKKNNGKTSLDFRKLMARKVFSLTSSYDQSILKWLTNKKEGHKIQLKYGENPNQKSSFYFNKTKNTFLNQKIQGKDLGYNNILDLDAGLECLNEFNEPTCVIIKHNNPCGVCSAPKIDVAFKNALNADPISAFGGIVMINRIINKELAVLFSHNFFEIIAAKKFTKDALVVFKKKKNLILIKTNNIAVNKNSEIKNVAGGALVQQKNLIKILHKDLLCVSKIKANKKTVEDLIFALKVCKHVKSNAVVLAKNKQTVGIGAGQMSRLDSTKISLIKRSQKKFNMKKNFVCASDAFFPFTDSVKNLISNNCEAIAQPKGSINDQKIIDFVNEKKKPLYFINFRLFKH